MPTVSGRVVFDINRNININGNVVGLNNIPVVLQNTVSLVRLIVLTNATGDYTFINVPAGSYKIVEVYGLAGGVPIPGDFSTATVGVVPPAQTPPIQVIPSPPAGATNVDCVTPNTILITVAAADILNQYIFNGPVIYTPLSFSLDSCATVFPVNLMEAADLGTFGSFPAGTLANTGPSPNPYPDISPGFTYVLPDPSEYTPIDGEYTIQNIMNNAMSNQIGAWWRIADHTSGNETGRTMIVNEDDPGAVIFRAQVSVSRDTNYLFSAWIANLFRVAGFPGPAFAVRILAEDGEVLYLAMLGTEIPVSTLMPEWKESGTVINSQNHDELIIEFFSEGEAAVGNDFALDDIGLRVILLPQFELLKSIDKNNVKIGDIATYTLSLNNFCEQPLTNLRFWDYLPQDLEFVPQSVTVNGVPYLLANPLIGFVVPDIESGTSLRITFQVRVTAIPNPNPAINRATLRYLYTPIAEGVPGMYSVDSNEVSLFVDVPGTFADISVTKSANKWTVAVGDTVVYAIRVSNNGPAAAQDVVLTDIFNSGITQPQYSLDEGATWLPWSGSYTIGTLTVGGTVTVLIKGIVTRFVQGTLWNMACVSGSTPDPNLCNNRASVCVFVSSVNTCGCSCGYNCFRRG